MAKAEAKVAVRLLKILSPFDKGPATGLTFGIQKRQVALRMVGPCT